MVDWHMYYCHGPLLACMYKPQLIIGVEKALVTELHLWGIGICTTVMGHYLHY